MSYADPNNLPEPPSTWFIIAFIVVVVLIAIT